MHIVINIAIIGTLLISCNRQPVVSDNSDTQSEKIQYSNAKSKIFGFYGGDTNYGIELLGNEAFLWIDSKPFKRFKISHDVGINLLEEFYAIPDIEKFLGKDTDYRQPDYQHLIYIRINSDNHSGKSIDYIIPKEVVSTHIEIDNWLEAMRDAKNQAEQAAPSNR